MSHDMVQSVQNRLAWGQNLIPHVRSDNDQLSNTLSGRANLTQSQWRQVLEGPGAACRIVATATSRRRKYGK